MFHYRPAGSTDLIEKFTNTMMWDGKKTVARQILQDCFAELQKLGHKNPAEVFEKALVNIMPRMEARPKRIGGGVYQIPVEVTSKRQVSLSIRWMLAITRKKKGQPMAVKLAKEIHEAFQEQGEAFKKKVDTEKMAEANKAYAHLANY